jgi:hypothetical protein
MASPAEAALELMRRLPPERVVENLSAVLAAAPELTEELLSRVDQPLQVATDDVAGRDFLLCDYNRDADSYRCGAGGTAGRAGRGAGGQALGERGALARGCARGADVARRQVAVEQRVLPGAGGWREAAGGAAGA